MFIVAVCLCGVCETVVVEGFCFDFLVEWFCCLDPVG